MLSHLYNPLKTRAVAIRARANQIERSYQQTSIEFKEVGKEIEKETRNLKLLETSANVLKEIVDKVSSEQTQRIVTLCTQALREIFYDKEYSVEIAVSEKRNNKVAELYLTEVVTKDDGTKEILRVPTEDSVGGGILTVIGFILRIYFISYYQQAPILLLDEYFSQVSDKYIPTLMAFIKQLAKMQNFIFICVFHDERFKPYGDKFYRVDNGTYHEEVVDE